GSLQHFANISFVNIIKSDSLTVIRYGLIFWGGTNKIKNILLLQKKIIRIRTKSSYTFHCRPLFIKMGFLTIINLYISDMLVSIHCSASELVTRIDIHNYSTRSKKNQ
ncbi:hypothetical protein C0J52_19616, partial [Blattella germanica]